MNGRQYKTLLVGFSHAEAERMRHEVLPTDLCINWTGEAAMGAVFHSDWKYDVVKVVIATHSLRTYTQQVTEWLFKLAYPTKIAFHYYAVETGFMDFGRVDWVRICLPKGIPNRFELDPNRLNSKGFHTQEDFAEYFNCKFTSNGHG